MAYKINGKLRGLKPYVPTQEITGVIHLDANESFLNLTPQLIQDAADAVQNTAFNRYPDPYAADLCQAFGNYYGVNATHVTAGNGSDELISLLISNFLMKGETIVTTAPDFSMYTFYPKLAETNDVEAVKGNSFSITPQKLIDTVKKSNARMLLFSNPCNPTSLGFTREEVVQIIESLPDVLTVVDEAYMDFWEQTQSVLGLESRYDNLVILKTCSKMGLAALRLGFSVSNEKLTGLLHSAKSPYNVNSLTQEIGALVLGEKKCLQSHIKQIQQSRDSLLHGIEEILFRYPGAFQLYRSCTNFVTFRFPEAEQLYTYLMECGISVRQFPGFLRITAGAPAENQAFLAVMESFFHKKSTLEKGG